MEEQHRWIKGIIFLKEYHFVQIAAKVGEESNNEAELLALWVVMKVALQKGIISLQLFCDFQLAIKWMNHTQSTGDINIQIMERELSHVASLYESISFKHI